MTSEAPPRMVIGIDPGGTTGVAWWVPTEVRRPTTILEDHWDWDQIADCDTDHALMTLFSFLDDIIYPYSNNVGSVHLIYEAFEFRKDDATRDKIDYTAAEVIGALRFWAHSRFQVKLFKSNAATGKGFWTDDKLKRLGLWVAGVKHAMDGRRHLLRHRAFTLNHHWLFQGLKPE